MHGVLQALAPEVRVVNLTHGVPAQDIGIAAFFLARSRGYFPQGTVFVAVVDPGVGTSRRILAAFDGGQVLLAPDNGLLGPALGPEAEVRAVDVERFALPGASATFHGRDIFCPTAARLARGEVRFEDLGPRIEDFLRAALPAPARTGKVVRGEVLFADRFGNLITNVEPADLEGDPHRWSAQAAGQALDWVRTYGDARAGAASILVNSYGLLEIAVAAGSAQRTLGVGAGAAVEFER